MFRGNFKLLAWDVDVAPLLNALQAQPELWKEITARQDHPASAHKDTEAIFLRGPREISAGSAFYDLMSIDYPARVKLPEAEPLIALTHELIGKEHLSRVMVVSLKAGGFITPHRDEGSYAAETVRLHVSLQSDEGNVFTCGFEAVHMRPGDVWWFDHHTKHEVRNNSERERIHLIVDWVR